MKPSHPEILVIAGTVREGRQSQAVARWYVEKASAEAPGLEFTLLDARDYAAALFAEVHPPITGRYSPAQQRLARRIAAADGFVFVTGEYNRSIPGSLKNFLDYVYQEWNRKPAALFTYGGSGGGVRAAEHLTQVLSNLGVPVLRDQLSIPFIWNVVDADGLVDPGQIRGDWKAHLGELEWWARTLREARVDQTVGV